MTKVEAKVAKELPGILTKLRKAGVRPERIATDLDVSFSTIKSWMSGRRRPKRATIQQMEHIYGVKIL